MCLHKDKYPAAQSSALPQLPQGHFQLAPAGRRSYAMAIGPVPLPFAPQGSFQKLNGCEVIKKQQAPPQETLQ